MVDDSRRQSTDVNYEQTTLVAGGSYNTDGSSDMSALLTTLLPGKRTLPANMEAVIRKPASPLRSEDGHSSHSGDAPTSPSRSLFPIHLQSSNILKSNCKMTVSNCLFYAVLKAKFQKTRFFLDRGLDVNSRNDFGYNALVAALHIDNDIKREKMFALLLRHGADPLRRDSNHNRNTLSWACNLGRQREVEKLLADFGGNLDLAERDFDGLTALHHATHAGSINIVRSLTETFLKYRLSVDVQDNQGMTPYVHARRLGLREIADILRHEGLASPSVSDSMYFKSPREWSQIGRFERKMGETCRRREERNRAKIEGRVWTRFESGIPENETVQEKLFQKSDTKPHEERNDRPRDTFSLPPDRPPADGRSEQAHMQPRAMSERGYDHTDGAKRGSRDIALSLIGLSGADHGRIAETFHHSQLDTSKVSEYSEIFGSGIHALMTILSDEQTPSFRKSVIHKTPPVRKASPKSKSKVSTLAILFGKDKAKGKNSVRKGKGGTDRRDVGKRKQGSKRGILPDIRLNDRAV